MPADWPGTVLATAQSTKKPTLPVEPLSCDAEPLPQTSRAPPPYYNWAAHADPDLNRCGGNPVASGGSHSVSAS